MALTDIDFNAGEGQDFIVEVALKTLSAPVDELIEASGSQYPVEEIPAAGGDIFIIPE